jgi:hypothetical protein
MVSLVVLSGEFEKSQSSLSIENKRCLFSEASDLADTVSYAIEQDMLQRDDDSDPELICAFCSKRGHRSEACSYKDRVIRQSNQAAGY